MKDEAVKYLNKTEVHLTRKRGKVPLGTQLEVLAKGKNTK